MSVKIKLNDRDSIDLPKLMDTKLLVLANSGGGKSWTIRRILEQSHGKVQQIVIDPEGEFGTLREQFDYVLAGKGGDTIAEPHIAGKLAERLLETKVSAIIDLYELHPQERKAFVRLFFSAMINAPKKLWHPVMVVLDEAHKFAPETEKSEALEAVVDMASRGRKRGFCLIPATQRPAKLSKDVMAECNNKLIGRASMDIDRKRSGEELGFTSKDEFLSLRDLEPGEFYAFGPAISREVRKVRIGGTLTQHPRGGMRARAVKLAKPSARIRAVLEQLSDLPKEAAEEANTIQALKIENVKLKQEIAHCKKEPKVATQEIARFEAMKRENEAMFDALKHLEPTRRALTEIARIADDALRRKINPLAVIKTRLEPKPSQPIAAAEVQKGQPVYMQNGRAYPTSGEPVVFGKSERVIYSFLFANPGKTFTKVQIAVMTGYSVTSGGFNNSLSKLRTAGLIQGTNEIKLWRADTSLATEAQDEYSIDLWGKKLPKCEREVFNFLRQYPGAAFAKTEIGERLGYSPTSGGFNNSLSRLNSLQLIKRFSDGTIGINQEIIDV